LPKKYGAFEGLAKNIISYGGTAFLMATVITSSEVMLPHS
jgi:hypothetical protein